MKSNEFWLLALVLLLGAMLLTPGNCQAQAETASSQYKLAWEKLVKDLNLTPEKAAAFQAVGAKYSLTRKDLVEKLNQNETDLEKAVAGPNPDENKIKELVPVIISDHNQLFESFKAQRQEEMSLLTPLQQAKYLLALKRWHEEKHGTAPGAK
jgi:Spy/CpxP family protein refolding chaperone